MLPKAHLTSRSRMSGCRWVTTSSWLSGSLRPFLCSSSVYSCHLFFSLFRQVFIVSVLYRAHLCMKCSLAISNFPEEISSLSHSIVFLYSFALITEEGFLISPCYSWELCIQVGVSFPFSFAFSFSSFLSYSYGLLRQPFCLLAFLFLRDGFGHCVLYGITNLHP